MINLDNSVNSKNVFEKLQKALCLYNDVNKNYFLKVDVQLFQKFQFLKVDKSLIFGTVK